MYFLFMVYELYNFYLWFMNHIVGHQKEGSVFLVMFVDEIRGISSGSLFVTGPAPLLYKYRGIRPICNHQSNQYYFYFVFISSTIRSSSSLFLV